VGTDEDLDRLVTQVVDALADEPLRQLARPQ